MKIFEKCVRHTQPELILNQQQSTVRKYRKKKNRQLVNLLSGSVIGSQYKHKIMPHVQEVKKNSQDLTLICAANQGVK